MENYKYLDKKVCKKITKNKKKFQLKRKNYLQYNKICNLKMEKKRNLDLKHNKHKFKNNFV